MISEDKRLMFLSTKFRAAVVFSMQSWLGESEDAKNNSSTPGYFGVGMSSKSLPKHLVTIGERKLIAFVCNSHGFGRDVSAIVHAPCWWKLGGLVGHSSCGRDAGADCLNIIYVTGFMGREECA